MTAPVRGLRRRRLSSGDSRPRGVPSSPIGLGFAAALALCLASPARAQLAASLTVQSDFRLRGLTLTDGGPAAILDLAYDHPSGAYAGVNALVGAGQGPGARTFGYVAYAGYVIRPRTGPDWEFGLTNTGVTDRSRPAASFDYTEVFAGVTTSHASLRAYYSPDYLRQSMSTLYVDLNASVRPATDWRLFAHAGVLTPLTGSGVPYDYGYRNGYGHRPPYDGYDDHSRYERYDFSAGVARTFGRWEAQVSFTASTPRSVYRGVLTRRRDGILVGLTRFF